MADTEYDYALSAFTSLPGGTPPALDGLTQSVQKSTIVTALDYITQSGTTVAFFFKAALSVGDTTTLGTIVAAHTGQVVIPVQPVQQIGSGGNIAKVDSAGVQYDAITTPGLAGSSGAYTRLGPNFSLRVQQEPSALFRDKFDGVSIDGNKWNPPITTGGGQVVVGSGNLALYTGTSALAVAALTTIPVFEQESNVYLQYGAIFQYEVGSPSLITNTHRFQGFGSAGLNTIASPLTDGIGLEVDTSGRINACIWSMGAKIFTFDLTTYQASGGTPLNDGGVHRLDIFFNTGKTWWVIDGEDKPACVALFKTPNTQILPERLHTINGATPPASAPTFLVSAIAAADTGHNNQSISDGKYPWRRASVSEGGSLSVLIADSTGKEAASTDGSYSINVDTGSLERVCSELLVELKKMNFYFAHMNDMHVHSEDVE